MSINKTTGQPVTIPMMNEYTIELREDNRYQVSLWGRYCLDSRGERITFGRLGDAMNFRSTNNYLIENTRLGGCELERWEVFTGGANGR